MNTQPRVRGFTLTEMLIVVALVAIILALSGPSLAEYVRLQRLRSISAELSTDLAFARSESVSRGTFMQVRVQSNSTMSCYVIYARTDSADAPLCDCTAAAGSRCTDPATTEVKTVQVPADSQVLLGVTAATSAAGYAALTINPRTGGLFAPPVFEAGSARFFEIDAQLNSARVLRTVMLQSGIVKTCQPAGSTVAGVATC